MKEKVDDNRLNKNNNRTTLTAKNKNEKRNVRDLLLQSNTLLDFF
jgi:hypothetical protein